VIKHRSVCPEPELRVPICVQLFSLTPVWVNTIAAGMVPIGLFSKKVARLVGRQGRLGSGPQPRHVGRLGSGPRLVADGADVVFTQTPLTLY